jgi:hypothetical protein
MINWIKNNFWPWGIVSFLVIFMSFFIGFAIWTFSLPINLVESEYYEKGQDYQQQIDIENRTSGLPLKPVFQFNGESNQLNVQFPSALIPEFQSGEIIFYYPADGRQDIKSKVELSSTGNAQFNLNSLKKGPWIAKFKWVMNETDYFMSHHILVN